MGFFLRGEANCHLSETCVFVLFIEDPNAWSIMGHLRYLQGNMPEAKDCYERTLSFVADAREMHAIYLRLASIYLQDGEVITILIRSSYKVLYHIRGHLKVFDIFSTSYSEL